MTRFPSCGRMLAVLTAVLPAALVLTVSRGARADVPPSCDIEAGLITCSAADVGKPCQGGGQCYAVSCFTQTGGSPTSMTVYKCDACPTVLSAPDAGCSTTNMGKACGDGGTCTAISSWCAGTNSKYVCATPAAAQPTGPPAGGGGNGGASASGGGGGSATGGTPATGGTGGPSATGGTADNGGARSGGGCAVVTGVPAQAGIAVGLIAIGLGFLGFSRRRPR